MAGAKKSSSKKSNAKKKTSTASKTSKSERAKKAAETRRRNAEIKRREEENRERRKKVFGEVKLWAGVAICLFLFLSNFGICGTIGDFFRDIMLGLFGSMGFIFPIVLVIIVGLLAYNKKKNKTVIFRVVGSAVLFIDLCMFFHLFTYGESAEALGDFYSLGSMGEFCGGIIGAILGKGCYEGLGLVGAYIVAIALLIISIVMLTEKSISNVIKRKGHDALENAKEEVHERREQRGREAEDKVAKGVNFGSTTIKPGVPSTAKEQQEFEIAGLDDDSQKIDFEDEEEEVIQIEMSDKKKPKLTQDGVLPEAVDDDVMLAGEYDPSGKEEASEEVKNAMNRKPYETEGENPDGEVVDTKKKEKSEGKVIAPTKKLVNYKMPPMRLLANSFGSSNDVTKAELTETANKLKNVLANFGVNVEITSVSKGPSVTRYEFMPEPGTRVNKITNLADDIKLSMAAEDIRIEAPIPGKAAVGIEIPNSGRDIVTLKELLNAPEVKDNKSNLAFPAGKDIAGKIVVGDVAKMPHMLIAGTTGAGKSVFTNSILMSILYRTSPQDVRVIVIDPKVVEFQVYNGIPHLLYEVVTDPKKAAGILNWAVVEMETRYKKFANAGTRDIEGYNAKVKAGTTDEEGNPLEKMPQILIIIDELADLMMVAAKEVEEAICRLAQLARAAGIHMIIATQRPSVDVITGLIKANVPSRVALTVASGTDSRTIIDMNGAEKLLGNGDMLFYPAGYVKPIRLQGALVTEKEIKDTVDYIKGNSGEAQYDETIDEKLVSDSTQSGGGNDERDEIFAEAGRLCIQNDKGSTSMLQRKFRIGFNRAARIMDQLYDAGVVGQEETNKPRKVLMTIEEFENMLNGEN